MTPETDRSGMPLAQAEEFELETLARPATGATFYHQAGKRLFDTMIAALGLLATAPLLAACAVAIRLGSSGPIFFRQHRAGQGGKPFEIIKFRTMIVEAERHGLRITADGDSRITPVGRWLRKLKMDELPQLFNVLKGEMSLVGPRPEVPEYVAAYGPDEMRILEFKPGVTSPASLAFIDEEKVLAHQSNPESYYLNILIPQKLAMDLLYCESAGFRSDIGMILATVGKLFERTDNRSRR